MRLLLNEVLSMTKLFFIGLVSEKHDYLGKVPMIERFTLYWAVLLIILSLIWTVSAWFGVVGVVWIFVWTMLSIASRSLRHRAHHAGTSGTQF